MTEKCTVCNRPLKMVGPQPFDRRGVEVDLMHCDNPGCPEFERTRSYHQRPMAPEVIAARREALLRLIAQPVK